MTTHRLARLGAIQLLLVLSAARPLRAADAGPSAQSQEAPRHFDLGLSLYEKGNLQGALNEFQRAHQIAPSYKVLFNLGLICQEMRDWAGALRYFREYLDRGADLVPEDRRVQLERAIVELVDRSGQLDIVVRGGPATITLNGRSLPGPSLGIPVNPGRHRVDATYPGQATRVHLLDLVGGEHAQITFDPPGRDIEAGLPTTTARASAAGPAATATDAAPATATDAAPAAAPRSTRSVARNPALWTWATTALLGTGALASALLADRSRGALDRERARVPAEPALLARYHYQTQSHAHVADALAAGSLVLGAVSLYLSFGRRGAEEEPAAPVKGPKARKKSTGPILGLNSIGYGWSF